MKKVLIPNVPTPWRDHLRARISAAKHAGLLSPKDTLNLDQATIVFPDDVDTCLVATSRPEHSINELLGIRHDPTARWVERVECLGDAAQVILDSCSAKKQVFMFCEAGYSKAGDTFLEKHQHILLAGNPLFLVDVLNSSTIDIATTLRAGRSTRILGVIKSDVSNKNDFNGRKEFFLCDALDGDSVIICPLSAA